MIYRHVAVVRDIVPQAHTLGNFASHHTNTQEQDQVSEQSSAHVRNLRMPNILLQRVQVKVAGAVGLSEGVPAMEAVRHSGIRSKTSPCRTDNEVVPSSGPNIPQALLPHHRCRAYAKWMGNEKSRSRRADATRPNGLTVELVNG